MGAVSFVRMPKRFPTGLFGHLLVQKSREKYAEIQDVLLVWVRILTVVIMMMCLYCCLRLLIHDVNAPVMLPAVY